MKFIKIFPVIFIFLTVISTVVFAATAPWGKAKFRNIGNVVTLGAPKVGSAVKTPYPTNRWFGSTYIYNRTSEEASYNPRASFKMAPRPLVFTTGNGLLDTNGQGYNLGFENFPSVLANTVSNFQIVDPWSNYYDLKVSAKKSNGQEINSDFTVLDNYSDWSATILCRDKNQPLNEMRTTIGKGFIFTYNYYTSGLNPYFTSVDGSTLEFYDSSFTSNTSFTGDSAVIKVTQQGNINYYGIYTSSGANFQVSGSSLTITFAPSSPDYDNRYVSVALLLSVPAALPDDTTAQNIFNDYYQYAYNFITKTEMSYSFDKASSKLTTTFKFTTENKRAYDLSYSGLDGTVVAVFPHQYRNGNIAQANTPVTTFQTLRGILKVITLTGITPSFQTQYYFNGILPALTFEVPNAKYAALQSYIGKDKDFDITTVLEHGNSTYQDTYFAGKGLSKAANLIPIFHQASLQSSPYAAQNIQNRNAMITQLRTQLQQWYGGSTSKYFAYTTQNGWNGIIGYPYAFGSNDYNDHHFHYGYFVYASALLALFDPSFALDSEYKSIVDLLIKDYANPPASSLKKQPFDNNYPALRNFDVYEGHSWASGRGYSNNDGIDQESSAEAMNAWAAIILWGMVTENEDFINLGVYGYTTELEATKEYYLDSSDPSGNPTNYVPFAAYANNSVGILKDNRIDYYVIWRDKEPPFANPPLSQEVKGIQVLPLTPSMLYLGYNTAYAQNFESQWNVEITGVLNSSDSALWKGIWYRFRALFQPSASLITDFENDSFPQEDNGSSLTYSYQFLNFFNALGKPQSGFTASHPAFTVLNNGSLNTYVAYNADAKREKIVKFYSSGGSYLDEVTVLPRSFAKKTAGSSIIENQSLGYVSKMLSAGWNAIVSGAVVDFSGDPVLNIIPASLPNENNGYIYIGPSFEITKSSAADIIKPIYLTVTVDSNLIPPGYDINDLRLVRYNNAGEILLTDNSPEIITDGSETIVISKIMNSGKYLLALSLSPSNVKIFVFPNPYKPSKHRNMGIRFANLKQGAQIKIFNIAGEMVFSTKVDFDGEYIWNVNNNSGNKIASGVYIYHIVSGGQKTKGKIAIER